MTEEEQFQKIRVVHRAGRLVREDHGNMSPTKENFNPSVKSQMEQSTTNHPNHGLVLPPNNPDSGPLDEMARQVLDDSAYNVLYDLVMSVYREEKVARCNTAAMLLEQKAQEDLSHDSTTTNENLNVKTFEAKVTTEFVRFDEDGNTSLIQEGAFPHIMDAIKVAHCPDCHLPRFPYPTVGEGSRVPEPGVEYCKKHVFVKNKPADIYNQRYAADKKGPGRGNGKKKGLEAALNGSQDSPTTSPPANEVQEKLVQYPSVKCPIKGCPKHNPICRIGYHLSKDHGNKTGRRAANRDALQKMQNDNANGNTSSGSRKSTPTPANGSRGRSSPTKRDLDEIDSDESPQKPKKAKSKKLQPPSMSKTSSQLSSSNLNQVETQLSDDEFIDDSDDHRDGDFGSISVETKKKKKAAPKATKSKAAKAPMKNGDAILPEKSQKKKATKTTSTGSKKPRAPTPSDAKAKIKSEANGHSKKQTGLRGDSESSQTLSSPN